MSEVAQQMHLWNDMVLYAKVSDFNNRFSVDVLTPDAVELSTRAIREIDEIINSYAEQEEWERQHSLPRRFRKPKRRVNHKHKYKKWAKFIYEGEAYSPKSTLRSRRNEYVPSYDFD